MLNYIYRFKYNRGVTKFWKWLRTNHMLTPTTLKAGWWSLTTEKRKDIGKRIVQAYCVPLPRKLEIREDSSKPWKATACVGRAILQTCLLGNMTEHNNLRTAQYNVYGEARFYLTKDIIGLPVYFVFSEAQNFYHAISGLLIDRDLTKLESWQFFSGTASVIPTDGSNGQIMKDGILSISYLSNTIVTYKTQSLAPVINGVGIYMTIFKL